MKFRQALFHQSSARANGSSSCRGHGKGSCPASKTESSAMTSSVMPAIASRTAASVARERLAPVAYRELTSGQKMKRCSSVRGCPVSSHLRIPASSMCTYQRTASSDRDRIRSRLHGAGSSRLDERPNAERPPKASFHRAIASSRARERWRSASSAGEGTAIACSCPARSRRASSSASLRSLLIRSPLARGVLLGATTQTSSPAACAAR
jgi:hypothetical protein